MPVGKEETPSSTPGQNVEDHRPTPGGADFTWRLVEACPAGILYLDAEGIITYENPAMRRIMGVPEGMPSPVIGQPIAAIPPIREAGLLDMVERCRAGEDIAGAIARYRSLMGPERDLEIHAASLTSQDGAWEGAIVMTYDITQRLQAEQEVQRRNRELALLNRVIAASVTSDSIESVLEIACRELAQLFDVPQAAAALLNSAGTEAMVVAEYLDEGRPSGLGAVIPVDNNASFQYLLAHKAPLVVDDAQADPRLAPVRELMQKRGTISLLLLPLLVEGEVVGSLGLDSIEPRPFDDAEIHLAERVASQISSLLARIHLEEDHRQLQEHFLKAQKLEALGQMAAGVAHDFNNLLTVIATTTELLEREMHPGDPLREKIGWIANAGREAAKLVRQLLRFGRQERVEPRLLDLNQSIQRIRPMLGRILGEAIELEIQLEETLWPVRADPSQMDQVLLNLTMNARAALSRAGSPNTPGPHPSTLGPQSSDPGERRLLIETANIILDEAYVASHLEGRLGEHVLLAVHDTGEGMDQEVQEHLFEPFYSTRQEGTGLGLAAVYGIVKQNEGHIRVDSQVGQGTSVRIYWPRAKRQQADSRAHSLAPSSQGATHGWPSAAKGPSRAALHKGQGTILVVEDEDSVRRLTARVLWEHGYRVLTAKDGETALETSRAHEGPINLLLTDIVMPRIKGNELARQLRQERPEMRVLYMSGYADIELPGHRWRQESAHGDQEQRQAEDAAPPPGEPPHPGQADVPPADGLPPPGRPGPFLAKPFSLEALLAAVQRALAGAEND